MVQFDFEVPEGQTQRLVWGEGLTVSITVDEDSAPAEVQSLSSMDTQDAHTVFPGSCFILQGGFISVHAAKSRVRGAVFVLNAT